MCARTHTRSTIAADARRGFAAPRQQPSTPTPFSRRRASRLSDQGGDPEGPTAHHPAHGDTGAYVYFFAQMCKKVAKCFVGSDKKTIFAPENQNGRGNRDKRPKTSMTKYQEFRLIVLVTTMVHRLSDNAHQEAGQGLRLHGHEWLTPTECHFLRRLVEDYGGEVFNSATQKLAQELIIRLKNGEKNR